MTAMSAWIWRMSGQMGHLAKVAMPVGAMLTGALWLKFSIKTILSWAKLKNFFL